MSEDQRSNFLKIGDAVLKGNRPAANLDFFSPLKSDESTTLNSNLALQPTDDFKNRPDQAASSPTNSKKIKGLFIVLAVAVGAVYLFKTLENSARETAKSAKLSNTETGTITLGPSVASVRVEEVSVSNLPNSQPQKIESLQSEVPVSKTPQRRPDETLTTSQTESVGETLKIPALVQPNSPEWQTQNPQQTSKVLSAEDVHILKSVIFSSPMPSPMQGFNIGAVFDRKNMNTGIGFAVFSAGNVGLSMLVTYAPRIFEGDARVRRFYGDTPIKFFSVTEDFMAFSVSVKNPNDSQEVPPIAYYFKYDIKKKLITKFNVSFSPSAGTGIGLNSINSFINNGQLIYLAVTPSGSEGGYRKDYFIETPSIINSHLCYTDYLANANTRGGTCDQKGYAFK